MLETWVVMDEDSVVYWSGSQDEAYAYVAGFNAATNYEVAPDLFVTTREGE